MPFTTAIPSAPSPCWSPDLCWTCLAAQSPPPPLLVTLFPSAGRGEGPQQGPTWGCASGEHTGLDTPLKKCTNVPLSPPPCGPPAPTRDPQGGVQLDFFQEDK